LIEVKNLVLYNKNLLENLIRLYSSIGTNGGLSQNNPINVVATEVSAEYAITPGRVTDGTVTRINRSNLINTKDKWVNKELPYGIPGSYTIIGDRLYDQGGTDLSKYLPINLNIKDGDDIIQSILGYRVTLNQSYPRMDPVILFSYYIKNSKTGAGYINEMNAFHFSKKGLVVR